MPPLPTRRPDLTDKGPLDEIVHLLEVETPIYQESAHLAVDTEGKTPAELADEIIEQLKLWRMPDCRLEILVWDSAIVR